MNEPGPARNVPGVKKHRKRGDFDKKTSPGPARDASGRKTAVFDVKNRAWPGQECFRMKKRPPGWAMSASRRKKGGLAGAGGLLQAKNAGKSGKTPVFEQKTHPGPARSAYGCNKREINAGWMQKKALQGEKQEKPPVFEQKRPYLRESTASGVILAERPPYRGKTRKQAVCGAKIQRAGKLSQTRGKPRKNERRTQNGRERQPDPNEPTK